MALNQFNGVVKMLSINRIQNDLFELELSFFDRTGVYFGYNTELGDVVYIRRLDGKCHRLVVSEILRKTHSYLTIRVIPESPITWFSIQTCVIVRETPHRKYPMFPRDTPSSLLSQMLDHYAILADYEIPENTNSCDGATITHKQVIGNETVCLENADGTKSKITLSELKEYFLTIHTEGGNSYRLDVMDNSFMRNRDVTDEYTTT